MTTALTAARRSTRRWNGATAAQRVVFLKQVKVLIEAAGKGPFDLFTMDWDGMDTPSMAARDILARA